MPSQSLFSLFTAGLACFAGVASAYTKPVGDEPKGNPISQPGLNSVVPVGKPFTITWEPTTPGTVTLVLLKGPAENLAVVGPIVEEIENTGKYDWTPESDLAPGQKGYGIQLIVDATGQYQYTTQFGISNPGFTNSSSSDSSSSSSTSSARLSYMVAPGVTSSAPPHYSTSVGYFTTYVGAPTSVRSSGYAASSKASNGTVSYSAGSPSYSAPAVTSPAASPSPTVPTGGASGLTASFAGLVVAAGVAILAL